MTPEESLDGEKREPLLLTVDERDDFLSWIKDTAKSLESIGSVIQSIMRRVDMLEDIEQSQVAAAMDAVERCYKAEDEAEEKEDADNDQEGGTAH